MDIEWEPFGTQSAYMEAVESGKDNMTISCELVVELVEALRAARQAPASGEVEPVGLIPSSGLNNLASGHPAKVYPVKATPSPFESHKLIYTHPPAKVPEGDELKALLNDAVESGYRYGMGRGHMPDEPRRGIVAEIMEGLTTPTPATTPETEWVKSSDRLPTEDDADLNGDVWVFWNQRCTETRNWRVFHPDTDTRSCYWKPTGLKRPEPPHGV